MRTWLGAQKQIKIGKNVNFNDLMNFISELLPSVENCRDKVLIYACFIFSSNAGIVTRNINLKDFYRNQRM